jgi:predicted ester cyclase
MGQGHQGFGNSDQLIQGKRQKEKGTRKKGELVQPFAFSLVPCAFESMSLDENKRLVHRLYDEAINRQDAVAAAGFYAADAINHRRVVGRSGMQSVFEALFSIFPDFHYRIENETGEGDRVVCKVMMTGTHLGRPTMPAIFHGMLHGVAPTGKRVEVLQYHDFRINGGKIVEHAAVRDDLGMLVQLGLMRRPE